MKQQLLQTYYANPLINHDFPDHSVIEVKDQGYFAYATHDEFSPAINNTLVKHSWDLIHWSEAEGALLSPPVWATHCKRFWCPHVMKVSNEFRLQQVMNGSYIMQWIQKTGLFREPIYFLENCVWIEYYTKKMDGRMLKMLLHLLKFRKGLLL